MEHQRLLELAGMLTEKKNWSADVKTKWSPPDGFFTKSAAEIVKGLLAAGEKKAMSRLNFYINRAGKKLDEKDKARLDKAKEMLSKKLEMMKEELEAVARRAGIILEKKVDMDMDGDSDPDMDMDDDEPKSKKDDSDDEEPKAKKKKSEGDEEEDPLPAIVHKIAKKAVGKDEEELETLIMKVYDAGHKDGLKDAEDEGGEGKKKKSKKDGDDAPKSDMPDMYTHHKSMKVKNKMDESVLIEALDQKALKYSMSALKSIDHTDKKGFEHTTNAMSSSLDGDDHRAAATMHTAAAEYHEKAGNKVASTQHTLAAGRHHSLTQSLAHALDHSDDADSQHKDVLKLMQKYGIHKESVSEDETIKDLFIRYGITEDTLTEKHHVKKKGKLMMIGSKKECKDYCDDNDGCTLHKGEPDEE